MADKGRRRRRRWADLYTVRRQDNSRCCSSPSAHSPLPVHICFNSFNHLSLNATPTQSVCLFLHLVTTKTTARFWWTRFFQVCLIFWTISFLFFLFLTPRNFLKKEVTHSTTAVSQQAGCVVLKQAHYDPVLSFMARPISP